MKEINRVIRNYMEDCGMTVTGLSEKTRIGRVNLGYKLKGKRAMTVDELAKIVRVLGIAGKDLEKGLMK